MLRRVDAAADNQMPHSRCCRNGSERAESMRAVMSERCPDALNAWMTDDRRRALEAMHAARRQRREAQAADAHDGGDQVQMPPTSRQFWPWSRHHRACCMPLRMIADISIHT